VLPDGPAEPLGKGGRPDLTEEAFDSEGFYRAGDAVAFADPGDPNAGLVFRGRIAEDFKLQSGTFVRVGAVRTTLLSGIPVLSDAVLAGENRDCVCGLAWLNAAEAGALLGEQPEPDGELTIHDGLRAHLARALAEHNDAAGSSARIERLLILARPASMDAGEITDKGYLNQRKVLARRAALVEMLYTDPAPPGVINAERTG
jgi:feruloyl-CoA synthase